MVRALLILATVTAQLAVGQMACSRPPDEVADSPIPPLKEKQPRTKSPDVRAGLALPVEIFARPARKKAISLTPSSTLAAPLDAGLRPQMTTSQKRGDANVKPAGAGVEDYHSERSEIWNSSEMREARDAILEFCRRSAQTSPAAGEQFLKRLSELTPEEMKGWLARYHSRQVRILLERDVQQMARQLMVERAISRQEAMRQAYARVSELRTEATVAAEERAIQRQVMRMLQQAAINGLAPVYDPFDATTDPMNPHGYRRRVAAAMTLPGDLPRNDPRNYLRGDAGADFGEWATTRDAVPPIPQVIAEPAFSGPVGPAPAVAGPAPGGE